MSLLPLPDGFSLPPKNHGARWKNFYQGIAKGAGNRHDAKCGYCLCSISGRPERLHNHVMHCSNWPLLEKTLYLKEATKENTGSDNYKRPREEVIVPPSSAKQQSVLSWASKRMSFLKINEMHDLLLQSIIYGGISFTIGDNPFFQRFVHGLCSSYDVPSSEVLSGRVLTEMFSKHLQKKLDYFPTYSDFTICFDGWTDVSGNSIYAFMVLKEEKEDVLDILDLSEVRHTAIELKEQVLTDLRINGVKVENALACVTDSPTTMVRLRSDLRLEHPNVLPIRCSLHGFNLLAKDVAGFPRVVQVCKLNQKIVNYFTSSHIWRKTLKKWQKEKKIPHFLSTFCETRWYSLSRVCLGVETYEDGFKYCLELSKTPSYPPITNAAVRNAIGSRLHFANNSSLVQALKPIVDVIGSLERRTTTLADVLESFIILYHNARKSNYEIEGLKDHILCAIGKRVKEFEDPIYFVALFLNPRCKKMAMSRKKKGDVIIKEALEIAKDWHFAKRDVVLLYKELIAYQNGDAPFDQLDVASTQTTREFWGGFCGASPLLRRFAVKVFSIVPHSGPVERLFSTLGLIKTKPRNRLDVGKLNMLGQINCELKKEVGIKKKPRVASQCDVEVDGISMDDFEISVDDDAGDDLLNEEIEEVTFSPQDIVARAMEEFFDFDAFEADNVLTALKASAEKNIEASEPEGEWSIDDIMKEFK